MNANYVSGSGSSTIVFEYTVSNGQVDDDGVAPTGNITLNGGIISTVDGDTPTTYSVPDTSGVLVDAQVPSISSISINNALYYFGEELSFTVSYDEEVSVDESGGTPRLVLNIGGTTKYADYSQGSGSQNLVFTYTVAGNDVDSDGILLGSPIDANGGSIEDAGANSADLTFISPDLSSVTVNGDIPVVTSSTIPSADTYYNGQDLDFTLTFSEDITVGGTPRLVLNIGGTTRYADYDIANSTSNTMAFKHSIVAGDTDSDGIAIATTIDLAGGSISDGANNAILTINLDGSAINVDYSNPQVTITTPVSNINIDNKSSYSVSGTCSEHSRDVVVVIGSTTVSPNPTCSASNTWSVSGFDASGQDDSLTFSITVIIVMLMEMMPLKRLSQ